LCQGCRVARVQNAARMRHQPELVIDGHTHTNAAGVEPTRSAGTVRRLRHGTGRLARRHARGKIGSHAST
jgi:hypothetical protein